MVDGHQAHGFRLDRFEIALAIHMDDLNPPIFADRAVSSLRLFQGEKNALTGMIAAKLVRPSKRSHVPDVDDFRSRFPVTAGGRQKDSE